MVCCPVQGGRRIQVRKVYMERQELSLLPLEELLKKEGILCSCGKCHKSPVDQVELGRDNLQRIVSMAEECNMKHPVIIADRNTKEIGEKAGKFLREGGIAPVFHLLDTDRPEPDEYWVGSVSLYYEREWDGIIAVGSGTINDICKIISSMTKLPYILVGTAPSMDGYASNTSSMVRDGLKVSIPSACPSKILLDTRILAKAPMRMIQAGLGDMAAKYVSLCEWKISHLLTGEYYCREIADLVKKSLDTCMESCEGLAKRDEEAAGNVAYGLVLSGIAMSFAGISRPASGMEHYFSHIWEMNALEHHQAHDLHGIQVGVGTLLSIPVIKAIGKMEPDREKALAYVNTFDMEEWKGFTKKVFGAASPSIIKREEEEQKYNKQFHKKRLEIILSKWEEIQKIIDELPEETWLREKLKETGAPLTPEELGISREMVHDSFIATKDIRDKYISTRLLWDLGMLEETADRFFR